MSQSLKLVEFVEFIEFVEFLEFVEFEKGTRFEAFIVGVLSVGKGPWPRLTLISARRGLFCRRHLLWLNLPEGRGAKALS